MKVLFSKKHLIFFLTVMFSLSMYSQEYYVGVGMGTHTGFLNYSNLNSKYFPDTKSNTNFMFSVYGQIEFGKEQNFAIRPQFSFLKRGGNVSGPSADAHLVRMCYLEDVFIGKRDVRGLDYTLSPSFFDVRVPLIYQFLKKDSKLRPYVFVAPVLGVATGGSIELNTSFYDDLGSEQTKTDVSKSNMTTVNFAAQLGIGAKYALPIAGNTCYIGLEVSYELGLNDTYSKDEKIEGKKSAEKPMNVYNNNKSYDISGTRKMNGLEVQATFSVPLSIFKKKAKPAKVEPVIEVIEPAPVVVEEPAPVVEEKPCYSMEEIQQMIDENKSVRGKVICAINDAIQFDFNKSDIKSGSFQYLDNLAKLLRSVNAKVRICGHTDNVGSADYNKKLSQKRAKAIMNYLVKKGVDKNLLTSVGFGMEEPLVSNDTEEGRAMNRRVEFEIAE